MTNSETASFIVSILFVAVFTALDKVPTTGFLLFCIASGVIYNLIVLTRILNKLK